jgi:4-carboxymuconolactone decarboxylase
MSGEVAGRPRIEPLDEQLEGVPQLNIFLTLAKHRRLYDRFSRLGGFLLYRGLLPARQREIVVLRIGWRSESEYEFGQHTRFGQEAGLSMEEIRRLATEGTDGWSPEERDLVVFADELCATNTVSAPTWAALAARWGEEELLELVVLAGFYRLVSGFLNTVGVQLEPGTAGWPDTRSGGHP